MPPPWRRWDDARQEALLLTRASSATGPRCAPSARTPAPRWRCASQQVAWTATCGASWAAAPIVNRIEGIGQLPAETELSRALSRDLTRRGFRFVGPVIVYAYMQSTGLVNDHQLDCFRHPGYRATRGVRLAARTRTTAALTAATFQPPGKIGMALEVGLLGGRPPGVRGQRGVRARIQQSLDQLGVAFVGGRVQRRPAMPLLGIDVGAACDEQQRHLTLAGRGAVERRDTHLVA